MTKYFYQRVSALLSPRRLNNGYSIFIAMDYVVLCANTLMLCISMLLFSFSQKLEVSLTICLPDRRQYIIFFFQNKN